MAYDEEKVRMLFEDSERGFDPKQIRRAVTVGKVVFFLIAFLVVLLGSLVPYTEFLWYAHDARRPEVFNTAYGVRSSLFLIAFLATWAFFYVNLRRALNLALVYLKTPQSPGQTMISHALAWFQAQGSVIVRFVAPVAALVCALGFGNEWNTYLLARTGGGFGVKDPMYGLDLGFFIFKLPWYRAIGNYVFFVFFVAAAASIGIYVGLQSLAALAKIELSRPHVRLHIGLLVGGTLLAFAAQLWLKTYEAGLIDSGQFTGAGYAAVQAVAASRVLAVLLALTAIAAVVGAKVGNPYRLLTIGSVVSAIWYGIAVVAYPSVLQRVVVDPDRLTREAPFAERAISMTRYAYGLDKIDVRDVEPRDVPTSPELAQSQPTLDNMRLWDPEVLRQALEWLQGFRSYYRFHDVDVDRYDLKGRQTMVMISPRDVFIDGLAPASQNWTNQRLRYTHGYGVAMTRVDAADPNGEPVYLAKDVPMELSPEVDIKEPRVYFSDFRDLTGQRTDEYALVRSGEPEFDYESSGQPSIHNWSGDRGVPISGLLSRVAFSALLGDGNLLVSSNIKPETRLLRYRNILQRASKILPFLRFDADPYIVVSGGRLVWILDGYTTTDMVPYASTVSDAGGSLNYIRNCVKVTLDAYTGEVTAYAIEPDEPILRAYRKIYPGLVKDLAAAPQDIRRHFRYPEDLFSLQTTQLSTYHVTDPKVFLSNSDAWNIPVERGLSSIAEPIPSYFVQMHLPGKEGAGFYLIRPFTPTGKGNMSGWLAAGCDGGDYGRLTLFRFTGRFPDGPELIESKFNSNPDIANINRQFDNAQSEIVVGNLLVIPIGDSVMYAESIFLRSRTRGIQATPRLTRVILALNDRIVVRETYREALAALLGETPVVPPPTSASVPQNPTTTAPPSGVRQALDLLDQADAALRKGDFAKYGELQKAVRQKLEALSKSRG